MMKVLWRMCLIMLLLLGLTGCNEQEALLEEQYTEKYIQDMELLIDKQKVATDVVYIGMVAGTEEMFYLIRELSEGEYIWKLQISDLEDERFSTVRLLNSALFEEGSPDAMTVDASGTIYMRFSEGKDWVWKIVSSENVITRRISGVNDYFVGLSGMGEGKIGLLHFYWQSGTSLEDSNIADLYLLDKQGQENLLVTAEPGAVFMTMQGDWLIYANGEGVYKRPMEGGEKELLYLWSRHGISFPEIDGMRVDEQGRVSLLMNKDKKLTYIRISPPEVAGEPVPTPKLDAEPVQITFLGNPYTEYRKVIVEFQKLYPQYTVIEVNYIDKSKLLTELTAGKGPVLIDTSCNIDFKENVEYWECLEEELEEHSLKEELLEKVQLKGKIDGRQYGIVSSWQLFTFATMYQDVESWNYEEFIEYIKSKSQLESIYSEQEPAYFIERYFFRDLNNCPFINVKEKRVNIDTPQFRELLELTARLAMRLDEPIRGEENTAKMISGTRLGVDLYILQPSTLAWDLEEFKGMNIIGFPGAYGSEHYINVGEPMVIRETATKKEKEAAFAFLEFLVSYEGQKIILERECEISVRKDVLEEQLQEQPATAIVEDGLLVGYEEPEVSKELWNAEFMKLYEKLQPYYTFPEELDGIIEEELEAYFDGVKGLDETIEILQNRVQLWVDENY